MGNGFAAPVSVQQSEGGDRLAGRARRKPVVAFLLFVGSLGPPHSPAGWDGIRMGRVRGRGLYSNSGFRLRDTHVESHPTEGADPPIICWLP
jgi:hypothetical protein